MRKVFTRKQPILYLVRCCSSLLFGKCGKYASKIISLILVFATIFSCAIPTYAEVGDLNTIDLNFTVTSYNAPDSNVESTTYDVTSDTNVYIYNVSGRYNGMVCYELPHNSFSTERVMATVVLDNNFSFNSNHEYNLSFSYAGYVSLPLTCVCQLTFYDSSGTVIKEQYLYNVTHEKNDAPYKYDVDIDFKPDITNIEGGYKCVLQMGFVQNGFNSDTIYQRFFVSPTISLTDKDDNSGWFQKILNKINDVWESIKSLPDKIGVYISNIASDIGDKIKDLFIPDEEYLQNKKEELETFCIEHFGAVYQSLDVFIDFLKMLINISPTEPKIIFPAIDIPLFDKTYHLTDEVIYSFAWVNDKTHFLYYFYNFYRSFVTVLLFLTFVNYCRNKYAEVFGGDKG